jgi:hypothetical protein
MVPSSASFAPSHPTVTAPTGCTSDQPDLRAAAGHVLDDDGRVGHRVGVGHGEHRGEPAERGGGRAGVDGLGLLAAGFAQVGVQVDEAGQQDPALGSQPGQVGHVVAAADPGAQLDDDAVADQQVHPVLAVRAGTGDEQVAGRGAGRGAGHCVGHCVGHCGAPASRW